MLSGTNQLLLPIIDSKDHSSLFILDTSFHLNSTGSIEDRQNCAPVFSNINKQDTIIAGTSVSIQLNVSDPDYEPINLSIIKGPQDGTLNPRKIFTWQSEKSDTGLTTIIFSATDGNVAVFDTFTIMVSAKKNLYLPVNYIGPFYSVASGTRLSLPFVVSDPDSDSVVVTIISGPDSAKILPDSNSDSCLLSWKTTTQDSGVHILIMSASDGAHIIIDTIEIYVRPPQLQNRAPVFLNTYWYHSTFAGFIVSRQLIVTDPDSDHITLTLVSGPKKSEFNNSSGLFTWLPEKADTGLTMVIFSASDGKIATYDTFKIAVADNNQHPPKFSTLKDYSVVAGSSFSTPFSISDSDRDSVIVKIESGSAIAHIIPHSLSDSRILTWETTADDVGSHVFILSAFDGKHTTLDTLNITVTPNNVPVFLNTQKNIPTFVGFTASIQLIVKDPDSEPLTISLVSVPPKSQYTESNRLLTWTPEMSDTGFKSVIFSASDGKAVVFDTFTVQVISNNQSAPPAFIIDSYYSNNIGAGIPGSFGISDPEDSVDVKIEKGTYDANSIPNPTPK
jgi:hypothetical protein